MNDKYTELVVNFVEITRAAGLIAYKDFRQGEKTTAQVQYKDGGSPVTAADLATDAYLKGQCVKAFADCAWFSEESIDTPHRLTAKRIIIADPIDGTRAFASGDPRWCVSLAMIEDRMPVIGCLYAPALDDLYVASHGQGATLNGNILKLTSMSEPRQENTVFGPKPMVDWLNSRLNLQLKLQPKIPSLALRIAMIASEKAHLGLASQHAKDWDIAAADLILSEAGGILQDLSGGKPVYNKPNPVHPALIATSRSMADYIKRSLPELKFA